MANSELSWFAPFLVTLVFSAWPPSAEAQQQPQGFAVERFYPAPPGSGWFVMDDLNMSGGLGGVVTFTSNYSRNPLDITSVDGAVHIPVVSNAEFINLGIAGTYDRYRIYFDFPMPLALRGTSGTLGAYQGIFRLLAAGDRGRFSYAGFMGVHVRPLNDSPAPGSPNGDEFLFGSSVGRKFSFRRAWNGIVGPEIYGETSFSSFFSEQRTAVEGLLTTRFERTGSPLRFILGAGHGFVQHFGAPEWRVLFGVELVGQMSRRADSSADPSTKVQN